jgi:integrase
MSGTAAEHLVEFDPTRDKSYQRARLGADIASFLAWYELGGASAATVENAERSLAALARLFPLTPIDRITDGQLGALAKKWPVKGRRTRMSPVKKFFKWGVLSHRVERGQNPIDLLPDFKRPPQKQVEVFTDTEVASLLELPIHDAGPLALLFYAGLRRNEAVHMKLRHCRPTSPSIKVMEDSAKLHKGRLVRMDPRLAPILADLELLEGLDDDDFVFYRTFANGCTSSRRHDKAIGEGTFSRWWHRCLDDAGVKHRKPHTARHTFATAWRKRGLPLDDLALQLGHTDMDGRPNTKSTLIYAQRTFEDSALAMAAIEAGEA